MKAGLRTRPVQVLAAFVVGVVAFLCVEIGRGALSYGEPTSADPCTVEVAFDGDGLDGQVQRFALQALNSAACHLDVTREELVLAFVPAAGTEARFSRAQIEEALKAGFDGAYDDLESQGLAGLVVGRILRTIVGAPVEYFLDQT